MTIRELNQILQTLPEETTILISASDISDIETVHIEYHADGRIHVILSDEE